MILIIGDDRDRALIEGLRRAYGREETVVIPELGRCIVPVEARKRKAIEENGIRGRKLASLAEKVFLVREGTVSRIR